MFTWLLLASCVVLIAQEFPPENRIVGGSTVPASLHPYIAALLWNGGGLQCGGSILKKESPAVILTAAHCVDGSFSASSGFVRLYASDYDAAYSSSNNYEDVSISHIVLHEDYIDADVGDDIALIFIQDDISNIERLQTVSVEDLSSSSNTEPSNSGDDLQVVGYGHDVSGGSPTDTLEHVTIPYVLRGACASDLNAVITTEMICAGGSGYDSCQGDSGGPLLRSDTNQQIGIVSWGYGCADTAGVYTNVGVYYDWIYGTIDANCLETIGTTLAENINVAQGEEVYYTVETDDDTLQLTITTEVTSGDADLYVRFGAAPTENAYDCRPYTASGAESCEMDPIQVGTYHIMVDAFGAVVGLSVHSQKGICNDDATVEPTTSEPSKAPTTSAPTTREPTSAPITREPTTSEPTTAAPTTSQPTTSEPTRSPTDNTFAPTTDPTNQPTSAPTSYASLWQTGKKVRFMVRDCDNLCINDREGSGRTNLADCDTGGNRIVWRVGYSDSEMKYKFKNTGSKKQLQYHLGFLKTKWAEGHFFQISYQIENGIYYVEMREVETDTCPQWNSCNDNSLQMVNCTSLEEPYNIRVLDIETSEVEPMPEPDAFIVDNYYNLTYVTIVFMGLVFVCWAMHILKMECKGKQTEVKVLYPDDGEENAELMDDL